jgi:hypothetical protein
MVEACREKQLLSLSEKIKGHEKEKRSPFLVRTQCIRVRTHCVHARTQCARRKTQCKLA